MTGHDRYLELAAIAIDFELGADERRELDDHLAGCRACRRAIEELSAEARSLASLPTAAAPERVRRTVLGAAERARLGRAPGRTDDRPVRRLSVRRLPAIRVALVAGLAVAPLVLAVVLLRDLDFGLGFASSGAGGGGAPPGQIVWTRLEPGPGESTAPGASGAPVARGPATLVAVAATPSGGVAVGHACGTEPAGCRAVAVVVDGDTIRSAPADDALDVEPLSDGSAPGMRDVLRVADGFVAVGATGRDGRPVAVTWRSSDGLHWVRAPDSPALADGWMNAVAEAGDGSLVAVGGARTAHGIAAAAWSSTDGMAWTRAADAPALAVGPADEVVAGRPVAGMWDVTWVSDRLVAVGADCRAGGAACAATAWTSSRGTDWSRLPADGLGPGRAASVVALDGAAAIVGRGVSSALAWRLGADGTATQRALQPSRVADLLAAASSGSRAVAVGTPGTETAGAWVTFDGETWAFYGDDLLRRATILGVALDGDGVIAVGDTDGDPGTIWIGRLEGVEP